MSSASRDFCEAVARGEDVDLESLLRKAVTVQVSKSRDAKRGHGVDRHLMGLRMVALEEQKRTAEARHGMPEIFTDPSYTLFVSSVLSTSNGGGSSLDLFGFGPVVPHGLGIGYVWVESVSL